MKRILTIILVASLCLSTGAEAVCLEPAVSLSETERVLVTDDPADYENGEVLVLRRDGESQVLTCDTEEELEETLEALAEDETVALVQPNYTYTDTALSTDDALAGEQWALDNDGTFYLEEADNDFPVFEDPFEEPAAPGQWTRPPWFGSPGGPRNVFWGRAAASSDEETVSAVAGIDINVQTAWDLYDGGSRDVVIALIDTGVDNSHEDLEGALWVNEDEIPGNGVDDDGNGYVDDVNGWNFYNGTGTIYVGEEDSHGTHGAGTIAASADNGVGIAGIVQSDHVKIMVLKVLGGRDGNGTTASIIQAIRYAETNGASICNLSLGSSENDPALYQTMAASNLLFVAAAGNDGADLTDTPSYPASYDLDNLITVANLNYDGTLHYSSNYGESVDLAAPGSYILSTTPGDGYSYMTGTSMAAPMVTAAAAMVYSYYGEITLADVKEILLSSVQRLDSLEGLTATGGMLDLGAAMAYDLDSLSGAQWDNTAAETAGSAPVISTRLVVWNGRRCLLVAVTDADGDLTETAWAAGTLTADQFRQGEGSAFSLDESGTAVFTVEGSGACTLYAADSAGNETVATIVVPGGGTGV